MGSVERREREKQELRTKILDAARELFVKEGYDAVTMRKIAERIEYSPTAIYLHFADKEALLREVVSTDFAALAAHFMKIGKIDDLVERMIRCGKAYVEFGLAHPNQYQLMFTIPAPKGIEPRMHEVPMDPSANSYLFLRAIVADAIEAGIFRKELKDVELVAQTFWAAVHGIVSLELGRKKADGFIEPKRPSALTNLMLDVLMRGVLSPAALKKKDR